MYVKPFEDLANSFFSLHMFPHTLHQLGYSSLVILIEQFFNMKRVENLFMWEVVISRTLCTMVDITLGDYVISH